MDKQKKGVRLEHISKIYKDPKTGKDFYAYATVLIIITYGAVLIMNTLMKFFGVSRKIKEEN